MSKSAWKWISLVFFVSSAMAGHFDVLPPVLQPAKQWIELVAFLGGVVQAWRINTADRDDVWTERERELRAKIATEQAKPAKP